MLLCSSHASPTSAYKCTVELCVLLMSCADGHAPVYALVGMGALSCLLLLCAVCAVHMIWPAAGSLTVCEVDCW